VAETVCLGELLVDMTSTRTDVPLAEAPAFERAAGGAPANVAVAARRLGGSAGFVGTVGDDPFGEFLFGVLSEAGVETGGLIRRPGLPTPLAFIAVRSDGGKDVAFHHCGGLTDLRAEDLDREDIAAARALHFGSISRITEAGRAATDAARRIAGEHDLLVSYDPNYRARLWPDERAARERILEGFEGVTLAKVSDEEWAFILGTEDFDSGAERLLSMGVELVVRSEGAAGASFATATAAGRADGFAVEAVEATGAGDGFVGSLLVDLLAAERRPGHLPAGVLERIVRRANAVGALATVRPGAIPALPTAEQVDRFLR
jgi:fructokinase